jgi:hypothetical protein
MIWEEDGVTFNQIMLVASIFLHPILVLESRQKSYDGGGGDHDLRFQAT